jgi:hypothetical protein
MPTCSTPRRTTRPRGTLVVVGARPPRPSLPGGSRNPHGGRPGRGAPSSAGCSPAASSDRSVCPCARRTSRSPGTQAGPRPQWRRGWWPGVPTWLGAHAPWALKRSSRSLASHLLTCCSGTPWASAPRGIQCPQHKKTGGAFRPLERGGHCQVRVIESNPLKTANPLEITVCRDHNGFQSALLPQSRDRSVVYLSTADNSIGPKTR